MVRAKIIYTILFMVLIFASCKEEKEYHGEPVGNYPNMQTLVGAHLDSVAKEPIVYKRIVLEKGERDTSFIKSADMPWEEIKEAFMDADIKKKSLDKKYSIDLLGNSEMGAFTLLHTALSPSLYTQSMSLVIDDFDKKLRSLYVETDDPGFFSSKSERLLLIPGQTIQIQRNTKPMFSEAKSIIRTYSFMN